MRTEIGATIMTLTGAGWGAMGIYYDDLPSFCIGMGCLVVSSLWLEFVE